MHIYENECQDCGGTIDVNRCSEEYRNKDGEAICAECDELICQKQLLGAQQ